MSKVGCGKQIIDLSPYKIAGTNESVGFCGGTYAGTKELCKKCSELHSNTTKEVKNDKEKTN